MQKYALIEYYSKMIRSGYFNVAWAILQALLFNKPIVIQEYDNDFFTSGAAMWLMNNIGFTHTSNYITIKI